MTDLSLTTRPGLPEALTVLLADYPRDGWTFHNNFDGLVAFWLDRHLNFRTLTARMMAEARAVLDGRLDPERHAASLSRMGNRFLTELHGHHQIEDQHFFPRLTRLERRLEHGFQMLETDHHAIDGLLHRFTTAANAVLTGWQGPTHATATGAFLTDLQGIGTLLDRHLTDEEDLIVPTILHHGPGAVE
jgi:iron-sulfur cluster repair protein YtfE (RIC family)